MLSNILIGLGFFSTGLLAVLWLYEKRQRRKLDATVQSMKKYIGAVDTHSFIVKQVTSTNANLRLAITYAKARLDRDFEREAVDKIASGHQH